VRARPKELCFSSSGNWLYICVAVADIVSLRSAESFSVSAIVSNFYTSSSSQFIFIFVIINLPNVFQCSNCFISVVKNPSENDILLYIDVWFFQSARWELNAKYISLGHTWNIPIWKNPTPSIFSSCIVIWYFLNTTLISFSRFPFFVNFFSYLTFYSYLYKLWYQFDV
jgi:hypothetical protein